MDGHAVRLFLLPGLEFLPLDVVEDGAATFVRIASGRRAMRLPVAGNVTAWL